MKSSGGPKSNVTGVFIKGEFGHRDSHAQGEDSVKTSGGSGTPESRREAWDRPLLPSPQKGPTSQHPDFGL